MLRPEFVQRKLALLSDDLDVLRRFEGWTLEALVGDAVALAAVESLVERIVIRAVDVNTHLILASNPERLRAARPSYRDTFLLVGELGAVPTPLASSLAGSAGLRNMIVHQYNDVEHVQLHQAIELCLEAYPQYIDALLTHLVLDPDHD